MQKSSKAKRNEKVKRVSTGRALKVSDAIEARYTRELNRLVKSLYGKALSIASLGLAKSVMSASLLSLKAEVHPKKLAQVIAQMSANGEYQANRFIGEKFTVDGATNYVLSNAIDENVALIKSIDAAFQEDIKELISASYTGSYRGEQIEGDIYEFLKSEIKTRGSVAKSRAKLIARDQTSKVANAAWKAKLQSAGVDEYIWLSSSDSRTRDSHYALKNKRCKFSDPSVYFNEKLNKWESRTKIGAFIGNPSDDYQCRCSSKPIIKL